MKRETCVTFLFILTCAISTPLLAAETPPDPEAWYRVSYASLWSDMPGDRVDAMVEHYAATNHKEYFAEATEAYFYKNDFYPFVRGELKKRAASVNPIGFVHDGMVEPTRDKKHGDGKVAAKK